MAKRGSTPNTRSGGQPAQMRFRGIAANPNGNREERRAAKKLGVAEPSAPEPAETDAPTCRHCGRTSHGFACYEMLGGSAPEAEDA